MAENRKHIDEIARDVLKDFGDLSPSRGVWRRIRLLLIFPGLYSLTRLNVIVPALIIMGVAAGFIATSDWNTSKTYTERTDDQQIVLDNIHKKKQAEKQKTKSVSEDKKENHKQENKQIAVKTGVSSHRNAGDKQDQNKHNNSSAHNGQAVSGSHNESRNTENSNNEVSKAQSGREQNSMSNLPKEDYMTLKTDHNNPFSASNSEKDHIASVNIRLSDYIFAEKQTSEDKAETKDVKIKSGKQPELMANKADRDSQTETIQQNGQADVSDNQKGESDSGKKEQNSSASGEIDSGEKEVNSSAAGSTTKASEEETQTSLFSPAMVSLQFRFGIERTSFNLNAGDNASLEEFRNEGEKAAWSYSAGGGVNLDFGGYFLETGLNYSSYRSNADYKFSQMSFDTSYSYTVDTNFITTVDTVNAYFDSVNHVWHYDIDSTVTQNYDSLKHVYTDSQRLDKQIKTFYELKYWEFPIMAGKYWNFGDLNLEVGLGVAAGFYTGSSGRIIRDREYVLIKYDKQNLPFRDVSFIGLGKVRAVYNFSERWSLLTGINMRYSLNSIYEKDYRISQKPYSIGVNIGIRYKL